MKKLENPFHGLPEYHCFGCAPDNGSGLQMEFFEDGEVIRSSWEPGHHFQGYKNVLHGGVQAALMDELASWYVFVKLGTSGVTQGMNVEYHKPVFTDGGALELTGTLERMERNIAYITVQLVQPSRASREDEVHSEAQCRYFTYPEHIARRKLHYPGQEAFYHG
jgi:acyl-coenzyme A thioesterase PaaI-like protein